MEAIGTMQLLAQIDAATAAPEPQDSPQSASDGDAPASPSSPSSPSKSNAPTREKPAKVLPCPRCESMNTKFCYYNNYSVTQPRHFCRQCQRYWTAGGTLRNVPVGGGSRKKNRHHPRGGEPYLQQRPHSSQAGAFGTFGMAPSAGQGGGPNGSFQQMLTQDIGALKFAQLPGFALPGHGHPYASPYALQDTSPGVGMYGAMIGRSVVEAELPPTSMHAMYGSAPILPAGYYVQDMPVKPEFWAPAPHGHGLGHNRVDSAMLLNLGLNHHPHPPLQAQGSAKPVWDQPLPDVKPPLPLAGNPKNGSPPHGSSTIEEEGSTPTNGYSNSGYEEGDTVSSMWHLHDDNMFQDSMFQLSGEDRC